MPKELYEVDKDMQKRVMFLLQTDKGFRYEFFEKRLYSF
jgi:hypothetical protein